MRSVVKQESCLLFTRVGHGLTYHRAAARGESIWIQITNSFYFISRPILQQVCREAASNFTWHTTSKIRNFSNYENYIRNYEIIFYRFSFYSSSSRLCVRLLKVYVTPVASIIPFNRPQKFSEICYYNPNKRMPCHLIVHEDNNKSEQICGNR